MVKTRVVRFATNPNDLCETYSDTGRDLKQEETGRIVGDRVIDEIAGYQDGKPYSRYTYTEVYDGDLAVEDTLEMLSELGVDVISLY